MLQDKGVAIVRRHTGGGCVYHDLGNLNFTFVLKKSQFLREKNTDIIVRAINSFGLTSEASGRNDIVVKRGPESLKVRFE